MLMGRMLDVSEVNGERIDMVIAAKFPAYYVRHPNKVVWLMHQHRQAYDLWGTPYGDLHALDDGPFLRAMIRENDRTYLSEAKRIFTIAQNTSGRLKRYNDIDSMPLYHPPKNYDKLRCAEYGDFIFYPSRIDEMKRQRVLVEAARHLTTDARICIAGTGAERELSRLRDLVRTYRLQDRVQLLGYISEDEKIDLYSRCLGVYFGAFDEDYGYITLEAFFSRKPVIVHSYAGGPLEFVEHGRNGFVLEADPLQVARSIDDLFRDRQRARDLGEAGYRTLENKRIDWDHVVNSLLGG
jgi:glycosyltransferase involved in cell wall biosynthesis